MGSYTPLRELAVGGQGVVTLARAADGTRVVLKRCLSGDPSDEKRLREEGRIGLRLQHPSIVRTLDLYEDKGSPVLVLEYVDGVSLAALRAHGPLDAGLCCLVGAQVAEALAVIHGAVDEGGRPLDLLHRDVTPANILVDREGRAKLIDLGIARSNDSSATLTATGEIRGTLRYLAPELFVDEKQSRSTDLWALGVVLVEAAVGRTVYKGSTNEILSQILKPVPAPRRALQALPAPFSACLEPLLRTDRSQREHDAARVGLRMSDAARQLNGTAERLAALVAAVASGAPPPAHVSAPLFDPEAPDDGAEGPEHLPGGARTAGAGSATGMLASGGESRRGVDKGVVAGLAVGGVVALLFATAAGVVLRQWRQTESPLPAVVLVPAAPAQTLIAAGSVWRYLDGGGDQGERWRDPAFDDSGWSAGPARLGFGGDGERTLLGRGSAEAPLITCYFRARFAVPDPAGVSTLRLRVQRDDGIAVYLNGVEVARDGLRAGAAASDFADRGIDQGPDEHRWLEFIVAPSVLRRGENVIATELHQHAPTSTDMGFDLELLAEAR